MILKSPFFAQLFEESRVCNYSRVGGGVGGKAGIVAAEGWYSSPASHRQEIDGAIKSTTTMDNDVLGGLLEKYTESTTLDDGCASEMVRNAESTSSAGLSDASICRLICGCVSRSNSFVDDDDEGSTFS